MGGAVCPGAKATANVYLQQMMSLSTIGRLLSVLAIIGLAVVPIARPAMALPSGNTAMADDAAMGMPEDMPCCPHQAPASDRGNDCPFMAMCTSQLLCATVQGSGLVMQRGLAGLLFPADESCPAGLSQAPPPRPPNA